MKKLIFTKMHGLGNDFIIIDSKDFEEADIEAGELAQKICNRNFGVGADGIIIAVPSSKRADVSWLFYNSDGTLAQMCGNGMRCFAKYVFERGLVTGKELSVETLAGVIRPKINDDGTVTVNMSNPILTPKEIPFLGKYIVDYPIEVWSKKFRINAVSMGNPHCVIFTQENIKDLAADYGPDFEDNELFPEKTNVEFINIKTREEIDMCVWERGCGMTLACGTGACASVVAGILNGFLDNRVKVNLQGGSLVIEWLGTKNAPKFDVYMTGSANFVCSGEYYIEG